MATALPNRRPSAVQRAPDGDSPSDSGGSTKHDKEVPQSESLRREIRSHAIALAATLDKALPLARREMETHALAVLDELNQPKAYLGWTMVTLATAFWRDQVAAVPYDRRLLLLPHCLRKAETCPAKYSELGLLCENCGACRLTDLRARAEAKGYQVLIAEGSPVVLQIILRGQADAITGVACLNTLEKALDKIVLAGIPCMAVPLLASECRNSQTDEDCVLEMIDTPHRPAEVQTQTYLHLMRAAKGMFDADELERLVPRRHDGPRLAESNGDGLAGLDPAAATEAVAYDFLVEGGKYSRPFVTLAVHDALGGGRGTGADGAKHLARLPEAVCRVALAIETFHKASLVHDDVEDDDLFRYGIPTLHRKYGTATAINVGDYLIGMGYRIVSGQRETLGAEVVCDVLTELADAHTRLCEGQGAELVWRDALDKRLTPRDALRIYALKTAPAFQAALYAGLRLAGSLDDYREPIARFARHLGVAFQILNDLDDWNAEGTNKRTSGTDVFGGRPTILWALALEGLPEEDRREMESLLAGPATAAVTIQRVRRFYQQAGAFDKAVRLVDKHRQRACEVAEPLPEEPLRRVLNFLLDVLLDRKYE